jgi:transposase InsO family protein
VKSAASFGASPDRLSAVANCLFEPVLPPRGEVLSVAFAIDCHDREVFAWTASPRPLTGGDSRTLMDKALWARFGETVVTAPQAIQWLSDNGPQYTATASVLYAHELGLVPITRRTARRATGSPKASCTRSNATT